jgi:hypothetical protein
MRKISLTRGKHALVDDDDYGWLMQWKWYAHTTPNNNSFYAIRNSKYIRGKKRNSIKMHRAILERTGAGVSGKECDHIDGNGLNNQRKNLRVCDRFQNMWNRGPRKDNKAGLPGICWKKEIKKWCVRIQKNGTRIHIGYFNDLVEAQEAYTRSAREIYGNFSFV